ncbi:MAG: hypothetical protein WCA31_00645, partial [Acidimicrobiales bacterium]
MPINVTPIDGLSPEVNDIRRRTAEFINAEVLPHEEMLWRGSFVAGRGDDEREAHRRESIELRETI